MKNKIITGVCILTLISIILTACATVESTDENASPETLYKNDNSIDMLIYNDRAYVNAQNLDWVSELEPSIDDHK